MKPAVLAVALMFVLAGCGGADPEVQTVASADPVGVAATPAAASPTPKAAADSEAAAKEYMELFAKGTPEAISKMVPLTEPGSAAHAYALHQQATAQAQRAGGVADLGQGPVGVEDDGYTLCDADGTNCTKFAGFKANPAGKLVSFTVDSTSIEGRLLPVADRAPVSIGGVSVRLVSAYRTVTTDNLLVTYEVKNDTQGEVTVASYDAQYVNASGQQAKAGESAGLTDIQSGASSMILSSFPGVDIGGNMILEVFTSGFDTIGNYKLKVQ